MGRRIEVPFRTALLIGIATILFSTLAGVRAGWAQCSQAAFGRRLGYMVGQQCGGG